LIFPGSRLIQGNPKFGDGAGNATFPAWTGDSTGDTWSAPKNGTVDARLAALEKNLYTLHRQVYPLAGLLSREKRSREAALIEESCARQNADRDIMEKIEEYATNGVYRSASGMWCICIGIFLCTLPSLVK
jgi:hypothetical protein